MLAIVYNTGKLSASSRPQKIFANFGAKKSSILFKNKRKILCWSNPPWDIRFLREYFISEDLKENK